MKNPSAEDVAWAVATAADLRQRPAYGAATLWLERAIMSGPDGAARACGVAVSDACTYMAWSFVLRVRVTPATMAAALIDRGFEVCFRGDHLYCNLSRRVLRRQMHERWASQQKQRLLPELDDHGEFVKSL